MNLIDDFCIIIWGEKPDRQTLQNGKMISDEIFKKKHLDSFDKMFCENSAILLSTNRYNFDKLIELKSFEKVIKFFIDKKSENILDIKTIHIGILFTLLKLGNKYAKIISKNIEKIYNSKIINLQIEQNLISLLELVNIKNNEEEKPKKTNTFIEKKPKDFKENILFLKTLLDEFLSINESQNLTNRVENLKQKLNLTTFSIGITGVMNAGKSTMLNALLQKEILGTSVVPETANLTIIKHSQKPHARVNFWNKNEWQQIEKSAKFIPQIDDFIKQTKEYFKDNLDDYITENGKNIDVKTNQLNLYTSAKQSNLKCNLVKSVELFEDLEFVKNGVSIVDTPGLDDPVVQREEITKQYLSNCDVLIHLMNVKQSATEKDVEFIIDSLVYGHISRLLVVITRIDTVSQDDLKEVIEYTKTSIKRRLEKENKEEKFNFIISKIDFLPIAGKLALMHRTKQENEALKLGYDLKKTGILQIEEYLKDVLFGSKNEKNRIFLQSSKKELIDILQIAKKSFLDEKYSLNKSSDELEKELEVTKKSNKQNLITIEKIQSQTNEAKKSLKNYFKTLENFIEGKLNSLKSLVIQRVCDDVSYEWRKNKKKPKDERIKYMIETTMKDGIVDSIRDYRYEFSKRMENELEQINLIDTTAKFKEKNSFNAKEYFEQNFGTNFLSGNYTITNQRVLNALIKVKKDDIEIFSVALDNIFKDTIEDLSKTILYTLNVVNENLLNGFTQRVSGPTNNLKEALKEREDRLQAQILLLQGGKDKTNKRVHELDDKINTLQAIHDRIKDNTI